jgi:hypothetical protein
MTNSLITPGHTEPASSVNMRYWCHKYLERKNCIYIEVTYSAVASKNSFEGDRHSAGTACQFYCNILPWRKNIGGWKDTAMSLLSLHYWSSPQLPPPNVRIYVHQGKPLLLCTYWTLPWRRMKGVYRLLLTTNYDIRLLFLYLLAIWGTYTLHIVVHLLA